MSSKSDLSSNSEIIVLCAISCYILPRYIESLVYEICSGLISNGRESVVLKFALYQWP